MITWSAFFEECVYTKHVHDLYTIDHTFYNYNYLLLSPAPCRGLLGCLATAWNSSHKAGTQTINNNNRNVQNVNSTAGSVLCGNRGYLNDLNDLNREHPWLPVASITPPSTACGPSAVDRQCHGHTRWSPCYLTVTAIATVHPLPLSTATFTATSNATVHCRFHCHSTELQLSYPALIVL